MSSKDSANSANGKNIIDYVPASWFKDRSKNFVYLEVFKSFIANEDQLKQGGLGFKGKDFLCIAGWGEFKAKIIQEPSFANNSIRLNLKEESFSEDSYFHIVVPASSDDALISEAEYKAKAESVSGLVITMYGRNLVYKKVFSALVSLRDGSHHLTSPVFENPGFFGYPILSKSAMTSSSLVAGRLGELSSSDQRRTELSLRWFSSSNYMKGVDAFINIWIALETLMMPNTTDIRPIKKALADIYECTEREANEVFLIGKMFNLRSRIVHRGLNIGVHQDLLAYTNSLYSDLFYYYLKAPVLAKAGPFLHKSRASLVSYFDKTLK